MTTNKVFYGQKLSERERHVVALVAHGLTNEQIGAKLHLTYDTIKTYTTWINKKLGAKNRAHAVTIAAVRGYINLHQPIAEEFVMACESSGCFEVEETAAGMVSIRGADSPWDVRNYAVDTTEAWLKFRDDIKAGKWDHIGESQKAEI
jgi:DNA-binding CsgD family transcriptional regulator